MEQKKLYTWERMTEALRTLAWDTQRRRE
jgi:hypothetical protein